MLSRNLVQGISKGKMNMKKYVQPTLKYSIDCNTEAFIWVLMPKVEKTQILMLV
jgi:hypothetical protein